MKSTVVTVREELKFPLLMRGSTGSVYLMSDDKEGILVWPCNDCDDPVGTHFPRLETKLMEVFVGTVELSNG